MPIAPRSLRRFLLIATALLAVGALAACAAWREDRVWIPDYKYEQAVEVYDRTGSIDLTVERLRESKRWSHAEINEAVYRIKKRYRLE